ncbi:hypothetical protein PybrP1_007204 [[Pythium] brassicae (nom. inval.)]|nr:hypothetical protein PybrP1_007204 [[Pythium] brassicae (nom. inval.)]
MFVPKFLLTLAAAVVASAALAQVDTTAVSIDAEPILASRAQDVFGEYECNNFTVYQIADSMFLEAERIWLSEGWTVISNSSGILNERKAVSGDFAPANVDITRARAVVPAPAQTIFDYLITPEGYKLIDPGSNTDDFYKPPLENYSTLSWRDPRCLSPDTVISGFTPRRYVTLNGVDQNARLFVSKSVQHRGAAGCSIYGPASCNQLETNPVRALNTFAVRVNPVAGDASKAVVELINFADFTAPEFSAELMNSIVHPFLTDMIARMETSFTPPGTKMMQQREFEERIARAKEAARLASLAASARAAPSLAPPTPLQAPPLPFPRPPAPHAPAPGVPDDVRHRVERLVEFIQRNGPAFEDTVRERERDNPDFGFLHPWGRFHDYFEWRKRQVCGATATATHPPLPFAGGHGAVRPPAASSALLPAPPPLSADATLSAMSVGALASVCKLARTNGLAPYAPLPQELLSNPAALPHVEPARLEIRLAEFYRHAAASQ